MAPRDPNTQSNYHEVLTTHVVANLEVDFEKKRLWGNVVLRLKSLIDDLKQVVLDTRSVCLTIQPLLHLALKAFQVESSFWDFACAG